MMDNAVSKEPKVRGVRVIDGVTVIVQDNFPVPVKVR